MPSYLVTYTYRPDQSLVATESGNLRPRNSRSQLTAKLQVTAQDIENALAYARNVIAAAERDLLDVLSVVRQGA